MGLLKPREERWFPRYHTVHTNFCVLLQSPDETLTARVLDVSREGLGVLVAREMSKGAIFEFEIEGKRLKMDVVYCQKDLIHAGSWRAGLRRIGSAENLVSLFAAQKCIDP